jgi:hypothetical protein
LCFFSFFILYFPDRLLFVLLNFLLLFCFIHRFRRLLLL